MKKIHEIKPIDTMETAPENTPEIIAIHYENASKATLLVQDFIERMSSIIDISDHQQLNIINRVLCDLIEDHKEMALKREKNNNFKKQPFYALQDELETRYDNFRELLHEVLSPKTPSSMLAPNPDDSALPKHKDIQEEVSEAVYDAISKGEIALERSDVAVMMALAGLDNADGPSEEDLLAEEAFLREEFPEFLKD